MPGGDRTGPLGEGPLTGRRRGFCGRGFPGRGRRFTSRTSEKEILEKELDSLEHEKNNIKDRLKELEDD